MKDRTISKNYYCSRQGDSCTVWPLWDTAEGWKCLFILNRSGENKTVRDRETGHEIWWEGPEEMEGWLRSDGDWGQRKRCERGRMWGCLIFSSFLYSPVFTFSRPLFLLSANLLISFFFPVLLITPCSLSSPTYLIRIHLLPDLLCHKTANYLTSLFSPPLLHRFPPLLYNHCVSSFCLHLHLLQHFPL